MNWLLVWLCGFGLLGAVGGRAATIAASMPYTNQMATFTDLQGNVYPNATLVRAEFTTNGGGRIIYKTNDQIGTVSFSQLSEQTLRNLGVPTNHTQIALDLDQQRKAALLKEAQANAEEQRKLLEPSNLIPVKIDSVIAKIGYDAIYGQLYSCKVHLGQNPGTLNILVAKLPPEIQEYFGRVKETADAVASMQSQISGAQDWAAGASWQLSQQQYQLNQAQAQIMANNSTMGIWVDPATVNAYVSQGTQQQQKYDENVLTTVQQQIAEYQGMLGTLQTNLTVLKSQDAAVTTRLMLPGRRPFNGFKVFICSPEAVPQPAAAEAKRN